MYLRLQAQPATHTNGNDNRVDAVFDTRGGTLGRDPHCQLVLSDPLRRISRIQGHVIWNNGAFHLVNASTSNAIYVDGRELRPGEKSTISEREEWRTGNFLIAVQMIADDTGVDASSTTQQAQSAVVAPIPAPHQTQAPPDANPLTSPSLAAKDPFSDLLSSPVGAPTSTLHPSIAASIIPSSELPGQPPANIWAEAHLPADPFAAAAESVQHAKSTATFGYRNDPFADLLGDSIGAQMAAVPTNTPIAVPAHGQLIPEDFNPLAATAISHRNTEDPLHDMRPSTDIKGLFPERSVDTIFDPAQGSIDSMTMDPLHASGHQRIMDASNRTDPLEIFSTEHNENSLNPEALFGSLNVANNTHADHTSELGAYFRAPQAAPEQFAIPASTPAASVVPAASAAIAAPGRQVIDIESIFDLSGAPDLSGSLGMEFSTSTPPVQQIETGTQIPADPGQEREYASDTSEGFTLPVADAMANVATTAQLGPNQAASDVEPPHALHNKAPEDTSITDSHAQALLDAFKQGAGLNDCRYPSQITPELMHMMGQMLSASVQGCMDLLGSRAAAKQEVRIAVTLINAEANNPLKFLPTGAAALAQIFGPRMPGFMTGATAIQNAYQDLRTHEMAMMAGTQAALQGMFERFAPSTIERQLDEQGRQRTLFHTQRQARLWEMYCNHYQWLREEMKKQTPASWGGEFHAAYHSETLTTNTKGAMK